jgi:drug/metabolite transporter (DMT)-like permease
MTNKPEKISLPLAILVAILAISTASIFVRFAQQEVPSLTIAALRLVIASLILAPIALVRYRKELSSLTHRDFLLAGFSGIFLAIHFSNWISSLEYTSVASSVVFVSTSPLWVALFSPLFLKERVSTPAVLGLILALIGGTLIGLSEACVITSRISCPEFQEVLRGRSLFGNLLALIAAFAVAGYIMIGRNLRARLSLIPYIFLVYSISAVILTLIMISAGQSPLGYTTTSYLWIFLLAVIPQLIGHSTFNWALRFLPAISVSITTLSEPIVSAILAFFILQETPGPGTLIGGIFILSGILLAARK